MDDLKKKEMFKHLDTLDGRDLMYFLILDCMEKSQRMDMDGLTAFLDDNLSDRLVRDYIKEEF